MARVTLPPGCFGLNMQDGTRYNLRQGRSYVEVTDEHASAIRRGWYADSGVMVATERHAVGTKAGRWCRTCRPARLWNAWNVLCPRCGADTILEPAREYEEPTA